MIYSNFPFIQVNCFTQIKSYPVFSESGWGEKGMGRGGDGEMARWGDGETRGKGER
ncbi:MAG: hypothetical protein SWZ49_32740 [Cyanobacteriota bacterium]|nr:hypothetical protein [Cyanobacteriota bacterium]